MGPCQRLPRRCVKRGSAQAGRRGRRAPGILLAEEKMKQLIAAVCFMLAATPFAAAQDKAKDADKKAPMAAEKSMKAEAPKADKAKADAPKGEMAKGDDKKSAKGAEKTAKKEPSEKQKAQQDKMRSCSKEAKDKNMKGDERKGFMKDCMKKS